ncbi:MAG: solute carrier family 23 protein [Thiomonas sp.]|nr:solute carrier family 23 protein [Thiomonas sp.]
MKHAVASVVSESAPHPVDEILPAGKLVALGIQHVLVMYAGAVAVPPIICSALKLPVEQIALLITADLFICGETSIIQPLGLTPWFGIHMPVMMGMTFGNTLLIVALGIGFGMIPLVAPQFFIHFPEVLAPMLHSGILLTAVVAFLLNAYFNGFGALDAKGLRNREHAAEDGAKLR